MKLNLPWPAQYAMRALTGAGFQAYIVGGSVLVGLVYWYVYVREQK